MAWIRERKSGRNATIGKERSFQRSYVIGEAADEDAALVAALAEAPTTLYALPRESVRLEELGRGHYYATVTWGAASPEEDSREFEMDIAEDTARITQSLATAKYPNVDATPDYKGAIGVGEDGRAEGVDVFLPTLPFSCKRKVAASVVDSAYFATLWELAYHTNNASYNLTIGTLSMTFATEELLFKGARLRYDFDEAKWDIEYRFHAQKSKSGLTIGTITGISKPGWRYLDVKYVRKNDEATAKAMLLVPGFVYVHQVYETGDFAGLGL